MGVTAFIPAKMTSRRLPRKNMLPLCGRPLLYYSIRVAQLAGEITEIVVSSESSEVLGYASYLGATLHHRDPRLAGGQIRADEVMRDWCQSLSSPPEMIALLQPTHPLRDPADLSRAIAEMQADPWADSLFTVIPMHDLIGEVRDGMFVPEVSLPRNRAVEVPRFKNTGSFYLLRPKKTLLTDAAFGRHIRAYHLPHPEWEVDIDYDHDLRYAEETFKKHATLLARYA
jgi:CMP-N-acetylneuraminic acid synthetase